jgi:hypothetical protein
MGFVGSDGGGRRRAGGKLAVGIAVLTVIAIAVAFIGAKVLGSSSSPDTSGSNVDVPATSAPPTPGSGKPIAITPRQLRLVDPPKGDRTEFKQMAKTVAGNENTGTSTDEYKSADFGGLKPGMGILVNLGTSTKVGAVRVTVNLPGASVSLRTGTSDPGASSAGDQTIATSYTTIGAPLNNHSGTVMVFPLGQDQKEVQYLLIWITKLPLNPTTNTYQLTINEITVLAP